MAVADSVRYRQDIPLDLLFNTCLGIGFAVCARDRLRVDGPFAPPASLLMLVYLGLIVLPVTLYLYAAHPAWTWMYLVNPASVPSFSILPLLALHAGALVGGWYLGARFILADRIPWALYGAGGGAVLILLGVALSWGRLGRYGSYSEFHEGRALELMDVKLGYVLVALIIGRVTSAVFLAVELVRDGRRGRSR